MGETRESFACSNAENRGACVTAKQQMQILLSQLPDNCTLSDIQAQLSAYLEEEHSAVRPLVRPAWDRQADSASAFEAWQNLVGR